VPNLTWNTLIATVLNFEAEKTSGVIDKILQSTSMLSTRFSQALFDEIPCLPHFLNFAGKEAPKPLPSGIVTRSIIEVANKVKNRVQREGHGGKAVI
jgi:hypothetical protein